MSGTFDGLDGWVGGWGIVDDGMGLVGRLAGGGGVRVVCVESWGGVW